MHVLKLNIQKAKILALGYILVTTTKTNPKESSAMATITQDMQYRLSLLKYAERFGVKLLSNIKPTVNTSIIGNTVMMVP